MKIKSGFVFFWTTKDYMSNWHLSPFTIDGVSFNCAEQWMMYAKAMLFGDTVIAKQILAEPVPREQKALGRKVKGFVSEVWDQECFAIMVKGCLQKFLQNPHLKEQLLATDDLILVEASPMIRFGVSVWMKTIQTPLIQINGWVRICWDLY